MNLGEKIKTYRQEQNYTQNFVANKLNISAQSISKWEKNISTPELQYIVMLSRLFNVSIDELLNVDEFAGTKVMIKPSQIYSTITNKYANNIAEGSLYLEKYLTKALNVNSNDKDYAWLAGAKSIIKGAILFCLYEENKKKLDFDEIKKILGLNVFASNKQEYIINTVKNANPKIVECFTGYVDIQAKITFAGYYSYAKSMIESLEKIEITL